MVKVSITLPNNAHITFESEEPEVIHEIVGMVLRDLPRELMQATVQVNGNGEHHSPTPAGHGTPAAKADDAPSAQALPPDAPEAVDQGPAERTPVPSPGPPEGSKTPPGRRRSPRRELTDAEQEFVKFCQQTNPLGDMRRVVVAAEGAARYLGASSVDAEDLRRLFDLAGWQRPHSVVQTLRNAARSKFRWLERVPGRSGHYTVTNLGRTTAFGS